MKITFTGHRPSKLPGGYNDCENYLIGPINDCLDNLHDVDCAYNGLALGFDAVTAWACLYRDIKVIGALPCLKQECKWPYESQKKYKELCDEIKLHDGELILVSDCEYNSYVMQKRNVYMVDNSDLVIACWDGSSGGTANCVKYAEACHKTVINIWDKVMERYNEQ